MQDRAQILLLCADPETRSEMAEWIKKSGANPLMPVGVKETRTVLAHNSVSVVFCEDQLVSKEFRGILSHKPSGISKVPLIVISRTGGWAEYLEALRFGAFEFIALPAEFNDVQAIVRRALRAARYRGIALIN
jgi:DNA-binding NtrC family response regulator